MKPHIVQTLAAMRILILALFAGGGLISGCTDSSTGPDLAQVEGPAADILPDDPPPPNTIDDEEQQPPGAGTGNDPFVDDEPNTDRVFIVDRTGKRWDVTYARKIHGMLPNKFQFGLGPFAIEPIFKPPMLSPGDEGYPGDNEPFLVLGATIDNQDLAYGIAALSRHEVTNDRLDSTYFAPAY